MTDPAPDSRSRRLSDPAPPAPGRTPEEAPFSVRSTASYVPVPRPGGGPRRAPLVAAALLLPAGLVAGWLAGRTPAPRGAAPPATLATPEAAPAAVAPGGAPRIEPAPPPVEPGSGVLSPWTTLANADFQSRRTRKPVLLAFSAGWSAASRRLRQEVFEDARLGEAVRRAVVPVSLVDRSRESDGNAPEVESMMQDYSIEEFPTLVVYVPGTGRMMRRQGYADAEATARWIQDAAAAVR